MSQLKHIDLHFIIAKERTGSSLLVSILNEHPNILSTSEEPFLLYFYDYYKNKNLTNKTIIKSFINDFWYLHEKSLDLYFSSQQAAYEGIIKLMDNLSSEKVDFLTFCKAFYLQFLPQKNKQDVTTIIDKQLKYSFYLNEIKAISPQSKFIFLVREPKDNITSCIKRNLGSKNIAFQAELWNLYYDAALNNSLRNEQFIIIKYEDLVSDTNTTIQTICEFLNLPSFSVNDDYRSQFDVLINKKKDALSEYYIKNLKDFHSGLLQPIDKNKIGEWQRAFNTSEADKIDFITYKKAHRLGYDISSTQKRLSLTDKIMQAYAHIYKVILLRFYLKIPFRLKVLIKKIRGKRHVRW